MQDKDHILITAALRFRGWEYCEDHPKFDKSLVKVLDKRVRDDKWDDLTLEEQMAVFFLLQRSLYKWGGDYLPDDAIEHKAIRRLFLLCWNKKVPEKYAHAEYMDLWQSFTPEELFRYRLQVVDEVANWPPKDR